MITLGTIQSLVFIVAGLVLISILLTILVIVHRQAKRVKELEMRMNAADSANDEYIKQNQLEQEEK